MQIDIQKATGVLKSLVPTPEEPEDGAKKRIKYAPRIEFSCDPTGLDQFLDNTQAGTKPSDILWWPGVNPSDNKRFPRWLGIEKLRISVNTELEYMLKLSTMPTQGETEAAYNKSRIEVAVVVKAKSLDAVVSANAVVFDLKTEGYPSDSEQQLLHELLKCEKLFVSYYQRQADLVQPPASAPRDAADKPPGKQKGDVVHIRPQNGSKRGAKGASATPLPPAEGADDKLFPDAVEHVVKTRKATIPDLQLKFKIAEARANELIAAMFELDIIGAADKNGAHEVRWTDKDIAESKSGGAEQIPQAGGSAELE